MSQSLKCDTEPNLFGQYVSGWRDVACLTQSVVLLFISTICLGAQEIVGPEPQAGSIVGIVMDSNDGVIPGATIVAEEPSSGEQHTITSDERGWFELKELRPAVPYQIAISAQGFAGWTSPAITLKPGEHFLLTDNRLKISTVETSVTAVFAEELALEQVKAEEKQRVLGVIPNFYVVYDRNAVPLTTKLKFRLALKATTEVVTIGAAAFLAGINQAADTPAYVQGAKGYGQRFGAAYITAATNILIGGAVLPSLLHQDPRYFYQGTGSKKSRALHAISAPFVAKADSGRWQFNYSSVGGDLASAALSNTYYPSSNRGPGLVFGNAAITTAGRIANALAQEFILRRLTSHSKGQN